MSAGGPAMLAGVIGWPVAQSLSPALHGFWLAERGIDGAYVPLAVRREDFASVLHGLRLAGFQGVSVTVPHKEAAFAIATRHDADALRAGAVNQLVFEGAEILGLNTDVAGLAASLAGVALEGRSAVLLGAGGAARAAVLALERLGAGEIRVVNRSPARAQALASLSGRVVVAPAWDAAACGAALVVQATSAGMKGAAPLDLALDVLPKDAVVCDIVYNPLRTVFLKRAEAAGLRTVDGLGMLMHQATPAFRAFYGVEPQVSPALRRALEERLARG
jgi:shikimate dehydrogenase